MYPGHWGAVTPDKAAVIMAESGETVTYKELDDHSNQCAQLLWDAGLRFGDHVAVLMDNNPQYLEICWAAQRMGLFYTCVNWHFTGEEAAYIIEDCDAQVLFVSAGTRAVAAELVELCPRLKLRLIVGSDLEGYENYETAIAAKPAEPVPDECEGTPMLYSSGTTGRPKGIKYSIRREPMGQMPGNLALMTNVFGFDQDSIYLSPAPLYHSAPLFYCMSTLRLGGTVVVMEHFDALEALRFIEQYGITCSQWVPTHFVRMFKLSDDERTRYDLSTLKSAVHAAAPCPVEVKQRMIEWLGPIVWEYYSATEGAGATIIGPEDWLAHPGSVGRSAVGVIHILDDDNNELPSGEVGTVWFEPASSRPAFAYHKDDAKTAEAINAKGWSTVGDMGYLDEEGYLYLTDRRTFMIVSGGVNIYPQEAENLLVTHPRVFDAAVFGIPDPDMGERVHAVVQPITWDEAGPELAAELMAFCRANLAHYKCPKAFDFDPELPRQATGKLYKRLIRDRYWGKSNSRIV
ncbi:MAG TPA: AMP-binding protein [Acidimicrobiia bacterium]